MKGGFGCSPCCSPGLPPCVFYDTGQYDTITDTIWGAQSFVAPPGGLTLYSATAYLYNTTAVPAASDCQMRVFSSTTYENDGETYPTPDAAIATLTPPQSVTTTLTFTSDGVPLTGSTRYWLVLSRANFPATGSLKWKWGFLSASATELILCDENSAEWKYSTIWVAGSPSGAWYPTSVGTPYKFAIN
jgi:hypothetical protein